MESNLDMIARKIAVAKTSLDANLLKQGSTGNLIELREVKERIEKSSSFRSSVQKQDEVLNYLTDPDERSHFVLKFNLTSNSSYHSILQNEEICFQGKEYTSWR